MTNNYIFYVDDTGINANEQESEYLSNEIVTYSGVLIREDIVEYVDKCMKEMIGQLKSKYGIEEFHFTDLYNGNNDYKIIDLKNKIAIIKAFASFIEGLDIKIFVQTYTKEIKNKLDTSYNLVKEKIQNSLSNNESTTTQNKSSIFKDLFKSLKVKDSDKLEGFMLTLWSLHSFIKNNNLDINIKEVVCDEGIFKAGTEKFIPIMQANKMLKCKFSSSVKEPLLQLADYVAWFISRFKNIMKKDKDYSYLDKIILNIYSSLSSQYINLKKANLSIEEKQKYDKIMKDLL